MNLEAINLREILDQAWRDLKTEGEAVMNALPSGDAVASEDACFSFRIQADRAVKAANKWTCAALDLAELCERERRRIT